MKYGNLNFVEPSGPLQACNGTALPLHHCRYRIETAVPLAWGLFNFLNLLFSDALDF